MTPGRREALVIGGVAVAAAAAGAVVGAIALQSRSGAAGLLSARYPDLRGTPRRLADWQGRALLCNFWATWCAPCREEIPLLVAAKQQHPPSVFEIVGIGIDSADKIQEFSKNFKISYPVLIADGSALDLMRGVGNKAGALPFTVGLDRRGALAYSHLGAMTGAELKQVIARLLG